MRMDEAAIGFDSPASHEDAVLGLDPEDLVQRHGSPAPGTTYRYCPVATRSMDRPPWGAASDSRCTIVRT